MAVRFIKNKIKQIIRETKNFCYQQFKKLFYHQNIADRAILQSFNYFDKGQKKVVICYLTLPHRLFWRVVTTQSTEISSMISVFTELGYCIDVISFADVQCVEYIKNIHYDLILGFGDSFYKLTTFQPEAVSILYMTEHHPEFSYQEEKKRLDYFKERHKKVAKITRSGKFYKLSHLNKKYSNVITMSETSPFINQYRKPYSIFPTGIINENFVFKSKDHRSARKHFLWLGSFGAIHKGLDLLIDVFKKRDDIVLHICGLRNQEKKVFRWEQRKNIIEYGVINIRSEVFLELVDKCSYIILPSCSEGFSTSVATGMLHGLIPIVMENTGFNRLGNNALFLNNYKLDYLDLKLTEFSNETEINLQLLSKRAFDFAREHFTVSAYKQNFRDIIIDIVKRSTN